MISIHVYISNFTSQTKTSSQFLTTHVLNKKKKKKNNKNKKHRESEKIERKEKEKSGIT